MAPPLTPAEGIVGASSGLALLALGVFVVATSPTRIPNRVFALLSFAFGLRWIALSAALAPRDALAFAWLPSDAALVAFAQAAAVITPAVLIAFAAEFPRTSPPLAGRTWARLAFLMPVIAMAFVLRAATSQSSVDAVLAIYTVAMAVVAALLAGAAHRGAADTFERVRARRAAVAVAVLVTSAVLATIPWPGAAVVAALTLVTGAGLAAFEVVRFQVVGIERRFRVAVKYVASTGVLVTFLIVGDGYFSEFVLEPFFGFTGYYWLFAGLAGVLLFKPIEALVAWIVGRVFPDPASRPELYEGRHGRDVYRAQLSRVLQDGVVTARERKLLQTLRGDFAMTQAEARRIETDVRRGLATEGRLPAARCASKASRE